MPTTITLDIDWMKTRFGELMFEIAQARGIANAAQQALTAAETRIAELEAASAKDPSATQS